MSWWFEYLAKLVKTYPTFTREYVLDELAMEEGWSWFAFAFLDDPMNRFGGAKIIGKGYIAQEVEWLVDEAHRVWNLKK